MKLRTRTVVFSAAMTALTVIFLFLAVIAPSGQLALVAVSSLFGIAAVVEERILASAFVYIGSSIIGLLLLPDKQLIFLYILFFGYYPILKSLAEKITVFVLKWAVKIIVFNVALTVIWIFFQSILLDQALPGAGTYWIYPIGNIIFIAYDIGLTRLISFYIHRISKNLKKSR